ncbi:MULTISPECIES: hypothetical protein [Psychrobacter]|uniref:Uncharacterized protein n=1 Tax=Psychrobacter alimentarius TaxID=261164 RepID=A0ABM5ZWY1_9GAMM|nr:MULTISPECIES: hypothetical protein [Psychrobacter]AMT96503.1 hypothetical protein A3K91_0886 [Psychrobacter alimentarius]QCB31108.1 hypothetical protein E5677_08935 [Psychrobacter sp. PAMC27889]
MKEDTELSVYELGIIQNSLRDRMVNIEEFRNDLVTDDDEAEMNDNIDTFSVELMSIKEKITTMIDKKIDDNCP